MSAPRDLPPAELDRLKAVRELSRRGVGGERDNARALLRRKLAAHGHTEASFDAALGGAGAGPETTPSEPLPARVRTVYVSGAVAVTLVAGGAPGLVRTGACGVVVRGDSLTLCGAGAVTVTLREPFRVVYASGSGPVAVSGFTFADVGFHLSGAGGLTVAGEAVRATFALRGSAKADATGLAAKALKIVAGERATLVAAGRTVCVTTSGHAVVTVVATHAAAVAAGAGTRVAVRDCPPGGRRASGPGRVRWVADRPAA